MSRTTANLLLVLAAAIWGGAFVPQQTAMRVLTPTWFLVLRFALTTLVLVPLVLRESRTARRGIGRRPLLLMLAIGLVFVVGNLLQQTALLTTSVANTGFLTSLYILFTPFVALTMTGEKPGGAVWPAAALGLAGAWLLSGGVDGSFVVGDGLATLGAVAWAAQIVLIGMVTRQVDRPFTLVAIESAVIVVALGGWAALHEPITLRAIVTAAPELAYTGLFSGFVGYSLQAIAQRHTRASDAAIVFSAEAPFSAVFGVLLLGDPFGPAQWAGSAAILAAVLLVQLWPTGRTATARDGARG